MHYKDLADRKLIPRSSRVQSLVPLHLLLRFPSHRRRRNHARSQSRPLFLHLCSFFFSLRLSSRAPSVSVLTFGTPPLSSIFSLPTPFDRVSTCTHAARSISRGVKVKVTRARPWVVWVHVSIVCYKYMKIRIVFINIDQVSECSGWRIVDEYAWWVAILCGGYCVPALFGCGCSEEEKVAGWMIFRFWVICLSILGDSGFYRELTVSRTSFALCRETWKKYNIYLYGISR